MELKSAKIILVNPENKVLLYLRDNYPEIPFPDYWDLFGGAIEKGESDYEAIKREVQEEIEITLEHIVRLTNLPIIGEKLNNGKDYMVSLFTARIHSDISEIKLNEGRELRYFTVNELSHIKFPHFYRDFIIKNQNKLFGLH